MRYPCPEGDVLSLLALDAFCHLNDPRLRALHDVLPGAGPDLLHRRKQPLRLIAGVKLQVGQHEVRVVYRAQYLVTTDSVSVPVRGSLSKARFQPS